MPSDLTVRVEDDPHFEAAVQKRLKEQADALRLAGVDKQIAGFTRALRQVNARLNEANNLKKEMVTKADFQLWTQKQELLMTNVVTIEKLDDNEFWVRAGIPHGLAASEQDALQVLAKASAAKAVLDQAAERASQRTATKVSVITAVVGALTGVIFALSVVLGFLATHHR